MREQEAITQHHANKAVANLTKAADTPSQVINLTHEVNKMVWGNVGNLCFGEPVSFEHLGEHPCPLCFWRIHDPVRATELTSRSQTDHHESSKHIYGKVAPYLEFFCYINSFRIVKSITVAVVASARKLFGLSGNVLGRAQLEK